jgi:hypothetical protein
MQQETEATAGATDPGTPSDLAAPDSDDLDDERANYDEPGLEPPAAVTPAELERSDRKARHVYLWLVVSPFLTVPWMLQNLGDAGRSASNSPWMAPASDYMWAVAIPALAHIVLLLGILSPSLYARRHTQQAMLLALLRTLTAVMLVGATRQQGWCGWVIVNGALWLFGSRWGLRQVSAGDCWLMRVRGEGGQLPRPWAITRPQPEEEAPQEGRALDSPETTALAPPEIVAATLLRPPGSAQAAYDQGRTFLAFGRRAEAVVCLMRAVNLGDAAVRRLALAELDRMGEVERG